MSIITAKNITVQFRNILALQDISFSIEKGEYIGLIGPNGAGKSTLLKTLAGIVSPTGGQVLVQKGIRFGYVPQQYFLNTRFSISVQEVIGMAESRSFFRFAGRKKYCIDALQKVGLGKDFLQKNFQTLSGGQKQRVIIARSLLDMPDVLLFDEPLSGVDFETKIQVYTLLEELNQQYGTTIVFVSHEIESIVAKCKRVLCLNRTLHEGCHPLEFARGRSANCPVQNQNHNHNPSSSIHLVHHHH